MNFIRQVAAITLKDVVTELRTKELLSSMLVFALLTVLIFSFAFDLSAADPLDTTPGVLWVTIAFAGTLGLNRSLSREQENGCIDGLLLTPADRSVIFFGKGLGNLIFIGLVELIVLPLLSILFNVPLLRGSILLVLLLGTLGYAAVGTLFSTMAVNTRAREVMLPVLLLPVAVPLFIAAVNATKGLLKGDPLSDVGNWLQLLLVYDAVIVAIGLMTFDYVVEE